MIVVSRVQMYTMDTRNVGEKLLISNTKQNSQTANGNNTMMSQVRPKEERLFFKSLIRSRTKRLFFNVSFIVLAREIKMKQVGLTVSTGYPDWKR